MQQYDIVINGGGIAGLAMASSIKHSGLSILLLEGHEFPNHETDKIRSAHDVRSRVSALNRASMSFIDSLDAWQYITEHRVGEFESIRVWDSKGNAVVDFNAADVHSDSLGVIIENDNLTYALRRSLEKTSVVLKENHKLKHLVRADDGNWHCQLDSGEDYAAKIVIAADGANSFIRNHLQWDTREWDYPHDAIVATIETHLPHHNIARQAFLTSGPIAFLPIKGGEGNLVSIVWSVTRIKVPSLLAMSDDEFCKQLSQEVLFELGEVKHVTSRFSFPLRQRHTSDYFKDNVVLIADAAHTIHPLAGQGINLGLQDVRVLAEEIKRTHSELSEEGFMRYQRRRKLDNMTMMGAMECFVHLFDTDNLYVAWMRNTGMRFFSKNKSLKKAFIKRAMGGLF
jgi:2-polyprenylphenol 6-hydroxylase